MLKGLFGKFFHRPAGDANHEDKTMSAKRSAPASKDSKKAPAKKTAPAKAAAPAPKAAAKAPAKKAAPAKAAPAKAAPTPKTAAKTASKPAAKPVPAPKASAKPAPKAAASAAAPKGGKTVTAPAPVSKKILPPKLMPVKKSKGKGGLAGGIRPYQAKKGENYMNAAQKTHFRNLLLAWKDELMQEVDRTVSHMKDEAANFPDPADRATQEEEFSLELRARDRERKLIKKIDSTLELIDQDDYGYCEACGIEIGVERLEVRPTATLCIDCKTLAEIKERQLGA